MHFNKYQLAARWHLTPRTIDRWRGEGAGPRHLKIGGRVLYRLEDIEAYEVQHIRQGSAKDDGLPLNQNGLSCVK